MANKKTNTNATKETTSAQDRVENKLPDINVRINRLRNDGSHIKANASVSIGNAFAVHGISVMEGKNGLFISMPKRSYTDQSGEKKYSDVFYPVSKEAHDALNKAVLDAYEQTVEASKDESENEDISEDDETDGFEPVM